jgi:plastocyanin
MHSLSRIRSLYALLAIVVFTTSGHTAGPVSRPRARTGSMSRLQLRRTLAMLPLSSNPSVNLGMIPLLSAYGMAASPQVMRANPYGSPSPYGAPGGYAGSRPYYRDYAEGGKGTAGSEGYPTEPQPSPEERTVSKLLAASGVPNDDGRLRWPIGLRILAAQERDELREQIDAFFQEAAIQAASGPVNSILMQEMDEAISKSRKLLLKDKAERFGMPLNVYNESERFLDRLAHAAEALQAGWQAPGDRSITTAGSAEPRPAQKQNTAEIGLYDNYFRPNAITIAVGATIHWTNHGQHHHTVTSDDRRWNSPQLGTNQAYTYTFSQPGVYHYHCSVHPQDMRGTIVVK